VTATTKKKTTALELAKLDLARSGIEVSTASDLAKMGLRALSREQALEYMPDRWTKHAPCGLACLLLEYRGLHGKPTGFWRLRRLEDAPAGAFGVQAELSRYHQAPDSRPYLWFSTAVDWPGALAGAAKAEVQVVLCEGEKKAEFICRRGGGKVVAIGLGGVSNIGSKRQRIEVIPDLLQVSDLARGFAPIICFDRDAKPKTRLNVEWAATRLGQALRSQGAEPFVATLPDGAGKVAPDDYIVEHGWDAFAAVLEGATELFPKAEPTDVGNATRLARRATGEFLFIPEWKKWLRWDGRRWSDDTRDGIGELAISVTRDLFAEAGNATISAGAGQDAAEVVKRAQKLSAHALSSQKRERISAMVALAPNEWPALKVDANAFDADPWLLNVENGTLDLRTGELRPPARDDLMTKLAPVVYDPEAKAPMWGEFLKDVLPSDGLRTFVHRFLGYCLTGNVQEHKMAFLHGEGRNGKGVLMGTVAKLMGDYATMAPETLLLAQKFASHPTELVTLKGRRLALASESDNASKWDGARLKRLTGGDVISARGMRENFFTFAPTHKFVMLSNPRPRADADDLAIWERLKTVPFVVSHRDPDDTSPEKASWPVADRQLEEKLVAEWPGILNWLVEGCMAWQKQGLGEPEELREAARQYQDEQRELDPLTQFLSVNAIKPGGMPLKEVTEQYNKYVLVELRRQEPSLSSREVAQKLRRLGYEVDRDGHGGAVRVQPIKVVEMRTRKF
jgi:P4 family phage/plasmid primase-like protien